MTEVPFTGDSDNVPELVEGHKRGNLLTKTDITADRHVFVPESMG
jgi:hypothetical protein